jgi:segregation and condensation protein B
LEKADSRTEAGLEEERLKSILESLLFAAGEPVSLMQLANALEEVPRDRIRQTLSEMAAAYASSGRGFILEEIAGGYQLRTASEHATYVRRLLSARPPRLSRPVLETLAIVAYRQPITRPEIEQLRGVDSGGVLDTLIERALIKVAGRKDAAGRPLIYATTREFLELFGLKDLESLPNLEEFRELEGLRDPAAIADPRADSVESPASDSASKAESPHQSLAGNPISDSPATQAETIETNTEDATRSEEPPLPPGAENPISENHDEPDDSH